MGLVVFSNAAHQPMVMNFSEAVRKAAESSIEINEIDTILQKHGKSVQHVENLDFGWQSSLQNSTAYSQMTEEEKQFFKKLLEGYD